MSGYTQTLPSSSPDVNPATLSLSYSAPLPIARRACTTAFQGLCTMLSLYVCGQSTRASMPFPLWTSPVAASIRSRSAASGGGGALVTLQQHAPLLPARTEVRADDVDKERARERLQVARHKGVVGDVQRRQDRPVSPVVACVACGSTSCKRRKPTCHHLSHAAAYSPLIPANPPILSAASHPWAPWP